MQVDQIQLYCTNAFLDKLNFEVKIMNSSLLQMNTIFISILIEALPFVLLGVIISGIIQIFVTDEMMARVIPKNKIGAVLLASVIGSLFPACERGIVPIKDLCITRRN